MSPWPWFGWDGGEPGSPPFPVMTTNEVAGDLNCPPAFMLTFQWRRSEAVGLT